MGLKEIVEQENFSVNIPIDKRAARQFYSAHKEHIKLPCPDPAGVGYKYIISSCSVGTRIDVECHCGAKQDITDYSQW